jgi:PAS domain S-box-containing protein
VIVLDAGNSMDLHALLLDSMPDIVFAKDLDGRYIAGNAAWAQLLGQPASALIGRLDSDLFPQDLANDFRRNDLAMLSSGQSQRNEEWVTYPDGRQALLETIKAPLRDAAGNVIGLVGVCREISANKTSR